MDEIIEVTINRLVKQYPSLDGPDNQAVLKDILEGMYKAIKDEDVTDPY